MSGNGAEADRRGPAFRIGVLVLIALDLGGLLGSIWLPMVTTDKFLEEPSSYSVVGGISSLFAAGQAHFALLILFFSVLFPIAKLITLGVVWLRGPRMILGKKTLTWLRVLSKWSMLDVLVVGTVAGAVQLGILADASARYGVYVFGGAILLAMIVTYVVSWLLEHQDPREGIARKLPIVLLVVVVATGILFVEGVSRPLMEMDKWLFWQSEYSVLGGVSRLMDEGNLVLALTVLGFVVVIPLLSLAAWAVLWLGSRLERRLRTWTEVTLVLDEWAMFDVFALALVVVLSRLGDVADIHARTGLWLMAAAAVLFLLISWLGRRSLRT